VSEELCTSTVWLVKRHASGLLRWLTVKTATVTFPLQTKISEPTYFVRYFRNPYIRSLFIRGFTDVQTNTHTHTVSTVFKEPLPWHVWTGVCVKMSQNLTVVSPEPLATWQPSGLKLTDITASAWPGKELKVTLTVPSAS
jgi:hypothetical protein